MIANTFGLAATADHYFEYATVGALQQFIARRRAEGKRTPLFHMGGGSNLLFAGHYAGTVLHSRIAGITVTAEEGDDVYVRVGAGVEWDAWVQYAIDSRWHGLENLSAIPGEVGASAVQNIGAYGVEACDAIIYVDTVDLHTGEVRHFTAAECRYAYRDSIFKQELRGRYAVTHVHFRLSHSFRPQLSYGGLRAALQERGLDEVNLRPSELRHTIMGLRAAKLPDPRVLGNAGSFFKNPVVDRQQIDHIRSKAGQEPPCYDVDAAHVKVPAAWLIEQCGWKGRALGPAAVYDRQALVLINLGHATGSDILRLCRAIQADVRSRFGIAIEPEVNIVGEEQG